MEVQEAQARTREVQRIMQTATLFTLLPGTAAVVGGLLLFAGCVASYGVLRSLDFADIVHLSLPGRIGLCVMWVVIALVAVAIPVNSVFSNLFFSDFTLCHKVLYSLVTPARRCGCA